MAASVCTIEVTGISAETLRLLDERVRQQGSDRAGYIRDLLDRDLRSPPFRQQVAERDLDDEDLDAIFAEAREEAFQDPPFAAA
jgi:hypothetical protein